MNYFELKPDKENKDYFLYFNNRQIYYTGNKPNFFKNLNLDAVKFFVEKLITYLVNIK